MGTEIKGKQIKDETITGDDVNESTLVLPQMYHSSADYTSNSIIYVSMPGRNNWQSSFTTRQHQQIAPYDGKLIKVSIRPTNGDASNSVMVQLRTNSNGNTIENGQPNATITDFTLTCANNHSTVEFIPSTPPSITKGHAFGFSLLKNSGSNFGHTNFVAVIEWDLGS